ncbi:MAG: hypothetical protein B6244_02915 [Candidatus Cloacimonetes bacterium 4572_55]|nr:MAG: hypothetical protein B6244_02915 [Candidatus Cloacimonetes bacterium 4572_55]
MGFHNQNLWIAIGFDLSHVADYMGQTVCHQIPDRSFSIDDKTLFVCSRCAGVYWGVVAAFFQLTLRGKIWAADPPTGYFRPILILAMAPMIIDAVILKFLGPDLGNIFRYAVGFCFGAATFFFLQPIISQRIGFNRKVPGLQGGRDGLSLLLVSLLFLLIVTPAVPIFPPQIYQWITLFGFFLLFTLFNLMAILYLILPSEEFESIPSVLGIYTAALLFSLAEIFIAHLIVPR